MKMLGIETATDLCGVGISDSGRLVAEYRLHRKYTHAERLPEAIERLCEDAGLLLRELDGVAVSIGPGSFTGLRIGLGIAKGIAVGLKKPLTAVPTMDGIIMAVPPMAQLACVLLVARKGEMYRSLYRWDAHSWKVQGNVSLVPEQKVADGLPDAPVLFVGEGSVLCRERILQLFPKSLFINETFGLPSAVRIAQKGEEKLKNNDAADIQSLIPMYLKRFQGVE
jgi:tRNA threonylcarbamoyladenosine biosynthesis protein TsaB